MKIEGERVCVTVSTVRRLQQDQISAENSYCTKLVIWSLETCALSYPRVLGMLQSALQALLPRDSRKEQVQRSESWSK